MVAIRWRRIIVVKAAYKLFVERAHFTYRITSSEYLQGRCEKRVLSFTRHEPGDY